MARDRLCGMKTIRMLITIFLVVLAAAAVAGFTWANSLDKPPLVGGRVVLLLGGIACLGAIAVLWSRSPENAR